MGQCSWIFFFCWFMSTAFFWISAWQLHPPCRLSAGQMCPFLLTAQETPPAGRWDCRVRLFRPLRCRTHRDDLGIVPYSGETNRFSVGADALIGPDADGMGASVFSARSGDIPRGAMWASPPYAENARCFSWGPMPSSARILTGWACPFFSPAQASYPTGRCGHRPLR